MGTMIRRFILLLLLGTLLAPTVASAATLSETFSSLAKKNKLVLSDQAACVNDAQGKSILARNASASIVPASVSKLYVFDWALATLPVDFRYKTAFYQNNKTLYINGGGDPHFVIEHLRTVLQKINTEKKVTINKIVFSPDFYFNWKTTPTDIQKALVESLALEPVGTVDKKLTVQSAGSAYKGKGTLYEFSSMPLPAILKQINNYSTNISTDTMFARLGGSSAFSAYMKKTYGVGEDTVRFETGSGLGKNHTTCELTLRVMARLHQRLTALGLSTTDILTMPVVDPGVLSKRLIDKKYVQSVLAKSGTLTGHNSLAGIINTIDGPVYFSIFVVYDNPGKLESVKAMIDTMVNRVAAFYGKKLKSFNYVPNAALFSDIRISSR